MADTCLDDDCEVSWMSLSPLNPALTERQTRFSLVRDFLGIRKFVSEILEGDQALLVF